MVMKVMLTGKYANGRYALVDEEDYDRVAHYSWHVAGNYARARVRGKNVVLHRFILQPPDGVPVDHIDFDGFNCCRSNLRLVTNLQNQWHKRKNRNSKSGYKGVFWFKNQNKWRAAITINTPIYRGVRLLGEFSDVETAAAAYDIAARLLYGEFAVTNDVRESLYTPSRPQCGQIRGLLIVPLPSR